MKEYKGVRMKRYSSELYDKAMEAPTSRIEKEFGVDGLFRAYLLEELKRDPEYIKKKEFLKNNPKRSEPFYHYKNLNFWVEQFPEDMEMEIYSYGVWCCTPWTIGNFKARNSELPYGNAIVKRIFKGDKNQLIFDIDGNSVYLHNKNIVDGGSRIEFEHKQKEWEKLQFSIDDYSRSKIQTNVLTESNMNVKELVDSIENSFLCDLWRIEVEVKKNQFKNFNDLSLDELNKNVDFWKIDSFEENNIHVQKLIIKTKFSKSNKQKIESKKSHETNAIILQASSCPLRY